MGSKCCKERQKGGGNANVGSVQGTDHVMVKDVEFSSDKKIFGAEADSSTESIEDVEIKIPECAQVKRPAETKVDDYAGMNYSLIPLDDRALSSVNLLHRAVNKLAVDVYQKISTANRDKNIVFSPVSIAVGLALLEAGASGQTQKDISKLINPSISDPSTLGKLYCALQNRVSRIPKMDGQIQVANSIFHDVSLVLNGTYLKNVKQWFKPGAVAAPFGKDSDEARQQINDWVSGKTDGKLREVFDQEFGPSTVCVLVNAACMKMDWAAQFDAEKTKQRTFHRFDGDEGQKVPFMVGCCMNRCAVRPDLKVLELPYKGDAINMYFILPHSQHGINDVEKKLTATFLLDLFDAVAKGSNWMTRTHMEIPKFTMRHRSELLPIFADLGIRLGQFGRMTTDPSVQLSEAVHEAYIEVDEKGVEKTSGIPARSMSPEQCREVTFIADHPFLFAVLHKPTRAIVFMGKVNSIENDEP